MEGRRAMGANRTNAPSDCQGKSTSASVVFNTRFQESAAP